MAIIYHVTRVGVRAPLPVCMPQSLTVYTEPNQ